MKRKNVRKKQPRNKQIVDEEIDSDEIPDNVSEGEVEIKKNEEEDGESFFAETLEEKRKRRIEEHIKLLKGSEIYENEVEEELKKEQEESVGVGFRTLKIRLNPKFDKPIRYRVHRDNPTVLAISNGMIYSAAKENKIVSVDINTRKHYFIDTTLNTYVYSMDIHNNKNLLCIGCANGGIILYDLTDFIHNNSEKPLKEELRRQQSVPVTAVVFDQKDELLFTSGYNLFILCWNITDKTVIKSLHGHSDYVLSMDYCVHLFSSSADYTVRLWKYLDDKHLIYQSNQSFAPIDCISAFNRNLGVTGSQDGKIMLWDFAKKKPIDIIDDAHGKLNWISAICTLRFTNIFATGSDDGYVRFWEVVDRKIKELFSVELCGYINDLKFSENGQFLAAQVSTEQKLGRWLPVNRKAKQGIYVIHIEKVK